MLLEISVTKWLDYLFNISPFTYNNKFLPNTKLTIKIATDFLIQFKWQNFAIFGHIRAEL